jgi:hypothetical protein
MVTFQLSDNVAAALTARAASQGMTIEAYLESIVLAPLPTPTSERLSFEEFERLLDAESGGGTSPSGTFSRADIYSDHD